MVKEGEENAAQDKARRELAEARNHADAMIHQTEKSVVEFGDKVGPAEKQGIESALEVLKEAVKGEDVADIQAKTQALMQASMKLGEAMYKAQGDGGEGAPSGDEVADDVVDAEFEDVNDDGKTKG
jgi:molecular chaperone DnaK